MTRPDEDVLDVFPLPVLADSVTHLDDAAAGHVVVCGSHGSRFPAAVAAQWRVRAIVFNDAGVGAHGAGVAGLDLLDELGIPAGAVSHLSAPIGDAALTLDQGVLSHLNGIARRLGCEPGMAVRDAVRLLSLAPFADRPAPYLDEARHLLRSKAPRVWALDSASLITTDDAGDIVLTGSHANLLGGRPETALKADALAAVFNDAGVHSHAGRLDALQGRGIAAATVDANTAQIGSGLSTFHDGVISAVNAPARDLGAEVGISARQFVDLVLRQHASALQSAVGEDTFMTTSPNTDQQTVSMNGGAALATMLKAHGVGPMFGMGGFQLLPFYDAVRTLGLTHHLIDDERSGAFAADSYARVTGRPGVCDATLGPGATNLVTALVESLNAGIPLVVLIGDTHRSHAWKNMTQETRQVDILRPAVKEIMRVEDGLRIPELIRRAFSVATSGRPGPVVLAVPEDITHAIFDFPADAFWADTTVTRIPARRARPARADVRKAADMLAAAKRPLILAGGGVHLSEAHDALLQLAEQQQIPVAHTLSGKGAIACTSPLSVGLFGRYSRYANELIESSDCLLVVGCKLGEVATKRYSLPKPGTPLIHLDSVSEEIGRWARTELGLWADAEAGLSDLLEAMASGAQPDRSDYLTEIAERRSAWLVEAEPRYTSAEEPINVARLFGELNEVMPADGIVVADGGFASHWAGLLYDTKKAGRGFVSDRGFASIGYGLPGALGAKLGRPDASVVGVTGDGGMNMTLGGLETARRAGAAFTLIVINNAASGYVKALQHAMYGADAYQSSDLIEVDYARLAEAYGCHGIRVENPDDLQSALKSALANDDAPTVIDVVVTRDPSKMLPGLDNRTVKVAAGDRPA
jgi:acetolactate synthase-1/2/3 large subunit